MGRLLNKLFNYRVRGDCQTLPKETALVKLAKDRGMGDVSPQALPPKRNMRIPGTVYMRGEVALRAYKGHLRIVCPVCHKRATYGYATKCFPRTPECKKRLCCGPRFCLAHAREGMVDVANLCKRCDTEGCWTQVFKKHRFCSKHRHASRTRQLLDSLLQCPTQTKTSPSSPPDMREGVRLCPEAQVD